MAEPRLTANLTVNTNSTTVNYLLKAPLFHQRTFYFVPMDPIPISFKHNGVAYKDCYFTKVTRSTATSFWHLYDGENCYLGRLRFHRSVDL
jgi:hypothetical protein